MLPTHNVPCPHCGRTLYCAQSLEDGANAATPSSRAPEHDAQGDFVLCPHCRGRVAMRRVDLPASSEIQIDREATRRQGTP